MNTIIIFAAFCLAAAAQAGDVHQAAVDYWAPAHYKFDYGVSDPHTGDKKSQMEVREGDVVKGSYSLLEADGTTRVVEYTADPHNGFNAVVKRVGHAAHPQVVSHGHDVHSVAAPVVHSVVAGHGGAWGGLNGGWSGANGGWSGVNGGHGGWSGVNGGLSGVNGGHGGWSGVNGGWSGVNGGHGGWSGVNGGHGGWSGVNAGWNGGHGGWSRGYGY